MSWHGYASLQLAQAHFSQPLWTLDTAQRAEVDRQLKRPGNRRRIRLTRKKVLRRFLPLLLPRRRPAQALNPQANRPLPCFQHPPRGALGCG